ncbi:HlyD family type I secretion periplasmic adaptor subunit [Nitratireductor sp. ZSWI3]|uniref:HlyD family type I secretion periplasmic adaptor subunit n=1 Tax=Nitratireductor sp. ZSWI3 TaxID=2966359 RepID=UPI0027E35CEF|nr:HlyD family type I secretion periplasmic adaptor subunit [Nitratireductor sp. ZSWI3]
MQVVSHRQSIRRNLVGGAAVVAVLVGIIGVWAGTADIAGAVIARGIVIVGSSEKTVQHPSGGVVGKILVRDGDRVEAGDLLVRLADTIPRANLNLVARTLDELYARKSRLEVERDGAAHLEPVPALAKRMNDPEVAAMFDVERRLFHLRRIALQGNKARLRERRDQIEKQIEGFSAQAKAKARETELIKEEIKGIRQLWEKKLVSLSRLTAYEREATRIEGERAQLISSIAQARGAIAEVELQILQLDKEFSSQTGSELREVDARIAEFEERKVAAEDQVTRIDIRAPAAGIVHRTTVHTEGGVIAAGEQIMLIVPDDDDLVVEAMIPPQDIDRLEIGQRVLLRFTAFNLHSTPEIGGVVSMISADVTRDDRTGAAYYVVRVTPDSTALEGSGRIALLPGMPVETFIKTGERKVISYLMKPLTDQAKRAFRDD